MCYVERARTEARVGSTDKMGQKRALARPSTRVLGRVRCQISGALRDDGALFLGFLTGYSRGGARRDLARLWSLFTLLGPIGLLDAGPVRFGRWTSPLVDYRVGCPGRANRRSGGAGDDLRDRTRRSRRARRGFGLDRRGVHGQEEPPQPALECADCREG